MDELPSRLQRKYNSFQKRSLSSLRGLIKSFRYTTNKIKGEVKEIKKRKSKLKKELKDHPDLLKHLDTYVGVLEASPKAKGRRNKTLNIVVNYLLGQTPLREVNASHEALSLASFKDILLHEKQSPLKEVIPEEIRAFLPPSIIVDVDSNGEVSKISDLFANKVHDLDAKVKAQRKLIRRYNAIVKKVKTHLKSKNERLQLSAIITSIIMETGIRPGRLGNQVVSDEGVIIETFGAITLTPKHVKFVKDSFAELKFPGKKGTENLATVSNRDVLDALQQYVDKALSEGTTYIFIDSNGEQYDYQHLKSYFSKHFKGFKITDFRKLRATEEVYNALKDERDALLKEIKKYSDLEGDALKEKVTSEIVKALNKAHERAQVALSHESSKTTKDSYINPEVVLRFLSTGSLNTSLRQCLLQGKTKLKFDPMVFVGLAKRTASPLVEGEGQSTELTLEDMVEWLNDIFY